MPTSKKKKANSVAATSGARELEQRRFLKQWWWFDAAQAGEKYEAALAWETIRRTRSYQALWRKYKKETVPLLHQEGKSTLAGAMQQMHFFQQARAALGNLYFDYLMKGFNPDLTWLELEEWQRLTARGFILGENYALKANKEYLLPRQEADQPTLSVGIVRLHRDGSGDLRFDQNRSVGPAIQNVEGTELFSGLRLNTPGEYAFVYFDTCGSREALLEAFDAEMQRWLGTALPPSGDKMDGKYWEDIARKRPRKNFSVIWPGIKLRLGWGLGR